MSDFANTDINFIQISYVIDRRTYLLGDSWLCGNI